MGDTNYFSGTAKLLTNPIQKLIKEKTLITRVWVEITQFRQNKFILVIFWGKLGDEIKQFYQKNDYLFIEGYISIKKTNCKFNKIVLTTLRAYPLFLISSSRPKNR